MKVCLVTLRHEYRHSGEIESIVNLQSYLKKNNVEADILTPQGLYAPAMQESKSGLSPGKIVDLWRLYRALADRHEKYDVIHLFLPFPSLSFYADFIKLTIKKKVVVTFESSIVTFEGAGMASFLRYETSSNLFRLCLNNHFFAGMSWYGADAYTVSSNYQKKQVRFNKIHVIPNLTDAGRFKKKDKGEAKQRLGFAQDIFVISYIGHLLEIKGVADLFRAFSLVSHNDERAVLALAFSGIGNLDKIEALLKKLNISERVVIYGTVDVSDFLSATDLLVVPYRYSFGTNWIPSVLLEGFSVGVPVLTSDLAPLRELNEASEVLCFARAGDPDHLASKMKELIRNEEKRSGISRNQEALMADTLNPHILAKKYIDVYGRVLQ